MSKRNFILLIIVLVLVVIGIFGFLYSRPGGDAPGSEDSGGTNFWARFNPFGNRSTPGTGIPGEEPGEEVPPSDEELAEVKLKKVSTVPVAGFGFFMKERFKETPTPEPSSTTEQNSKEEAKPPSSLGGLASKSKPVPPPTEFAEAVRYVDRATGNIYQTFIDKLEERKFSRTLIPKVYEAYFGNGGQSVIMRNLRQNNITIGTFVATLPKEKLGEDITSNEITGTFIEDNIRDMSVSPDMSKLFYRLEAGNGTTGTIMNLSDRKKTMVFDSAFTEWNSWWPSSKIITLTTRPSGIVSGYMYMINADTKNFTQVLGNINGLTTLMSPNATLVLVGNNNLSLYVYNMDTKNYQQLSLQTLPEKCVWNKTSEFIYCAAPTGIPNALYPDDWYQGEVSFSDQIWRIDVKDGSTSLIIDPLTVLGGEDVDGVKLALNKDETYLLFVNKKDSYLWELSLK